MARFDDLMLDTQAWGTWHPPAATEPVFQIDGEGGPDARPGLVIEATGANNACGCWRLPLRFESTRFYWVEVVFRTEGMAAPQKSVRAILTTPDEGGDSFYDQLNPGGDRDGWSVLHRDLDGSTVPDTLTLNLFLAYPRAGHVVWSEARCYEFNSRPSRKVRVAAVSGNPPEDGSPSDSADFYCERLDGLAEGDRPDIVVLPELINVMGLRDAVGFAEPIPGPTSLRLAERARMHGFWIAASLQETYSGAVWNTGVLIDRHGGFVGKYRKTHPTLSESLLNGTVPGDDYPVFQTEFGTVGYLICYDNHYPEVARCLSLKGAELLLFSNAGDGREEGDLWEAYVRTRALDNQVHIAAAVNNASQSMIVSPRGEILERADGSPGGTALAECDLDVTVRDSTGRPLSRRYDVLRRSDTFGALVESIFD